MSTADGSVLGHTQIYGSAPLNRALNVVLMGDGFTSAQQPAFNAAANAFVNTLRGTHPFDDLSPAINVFRINVTSTDSGADDPASAGGSGATARTYFDSSFGGGGLRRLLLCNTTTALTVAAAQVPQFTVAIVVVNSTVYGGGGGSVATYSLAGGATEIALHEMGHTAFLLGDEYAYYAGGNETGHDHHPASEPNRPNTTINTDRNTLKWRWAVAPTTPIPTMTNPNCATVDTRPSPVPAGTVGEFEGADYYHCGAYRPEYDCKMRSLGVPYCRICTQVIWNSLAPLTELDARPQTPISVIARYPEHLDVFAAASTGGTMSDWWDSASGWAGWFQLAGGVASPGGTGSPITAINRYSGHIDVFTVGTNNRVYTAWWDRSSGWSGWSTIGNLTCRPGSTVNVVARYADHLDLFTTGSNGEVMSTWWDARTGWGNWFQVQGGIAANGATVTAVARYPFHLDVFTVGTDTRVYSCWWDDRSGWHPWFALDGIVCRPNSTVSVVARYPDHLDLFTTASDSRIMSTWWDARTGWGNWFQVQGGLASPGSPVTAIARYSNQLDLFVVGTNNRIYSTWWHDPGGWGNWFNVSGGIGNPGGQVAAISRVAEHIDIFTVGSDGKAYSTWWDCTSGWANWFRLSVS